MTNIIETIEDQVADIVRYASAFAERYERYCVEANKPSKECNNSLKSELFDAAMISATKAYKTANNAGLNPKSVCPSCCYFIECHFSKDIAGQVAARGGAN